MGIPVKEYNSIREIYDKLNQLRKNTEECSQKLLADFSADKWTDTKLLQSLSEAVTHLGTVQEGLLDKLNQCKIEIKPTVADTGLSIEDWHRKELNKYITQEITHTLDEVCCISCDEKEKDVCTELKKIQEEAISIKNDLKNYEKYTNRIDDFKALLGWIKEETPLKMEEAQHCQEKFGFKLMYAVMSKLLHIGTIPTVASAPAVEPAPVKEEVNTPAKTQNAEEPKKEEIKEATAPVRVDVPSCEMYDDSLAVEGNNVKDKMLVSFAKFKNEFQKHIGPKNFFAMAQQILGKSIDRLAVSANPSPKHFDNMSGYRDYLGAAANLYAMGVIQKITFRGIDDYRLNPQLRDIAMTDSFKKFTDYQLSAKVSPSFVANGPLKIWLARAILRNYLIEELAEEYPVSKVVNVTKQEMTSCVAHFFGTNSKTKGVYINLITPLFTPESVADDVAAIEKAFDESKKQPSNYIILIQNEEEKTYWKERAKPYNLQSLHFFYIGEGFKSEKEAKEEIAKSKTTDVTLEIGTESDVSMVQKHQTLLDFIKPEKTSTAPAKEKPQAKKKPTQEKNSPKKAAKPEVQETVEEEDSPVVFMETSFEKEIPEKIKMVSEQIEKHHIAEGMLILHAIDHQLHTDWSHRLLTQVSYILGDPLYPRIPKKESPDNYWNYTVDIPDVDAGYARDYFNVAAMIRYFFKPSYGDGKEEYYQPQIIWNQLNNDTSNQLLQKIPEIKKVISVFYDFWRKQRNQKGLGSCLGGKNQVQKLQTQEFNLCKNELKSTKQLLDNKKSNVPSFPRLTWTYDELCRNSDLYLYVSTADECSVEEIMNYCNQFTETPMTPSQALNQDTFSYEVSIDTLDAEIDKVWDSIDVPRRQTSGLIGKHRNSLRKILSNSLYALAHYAFERCRVENNQNNDIDLTAVEKAKQRAEEYSSELMKKLKDCHSDNMVEEIAICSLKYLIKFLMKSFNSNYEQMEFYEPFLLTQHVELDSRYIPVVDFDYEVPGMSLYNRCIKHIEEIEAQKLEPKAEYYGKVREEARSASNMGFYKLLTHKLNLPETEYKEEFIMNEGQKYLTKMQENFKSDLELAYNYGRLTQKNEILFYESLAEDVKIHLLETQNFGLFNDFTAACKENIDANSKPRQEELEKQFDAVKVNLKKKLEETGESMDDYSIIQEIQNCLKNHNYSVAEDWIRQCQDGNLTGIKSMLGNTPDEFMHYKDTYQSYYNVCSRNAKYTLDATLTRWCAETLKSRDVLNKNAVGKGQISFVQTWDKLFGFSGKTNLEGSKAVVQSFIEGLGYPKIAATDVTPAKQTANRIAYDVQFTSEPIRNYAHPFKQFGSGIFERGLKIITFPGAHTPKNIVNELNGAGLEREVGTICLVDTSMPWADRCKLAEIMKCSSTLYNVIVIDRVMALYLSQFERLDRENKMMKLCMPFANATPFAATGFIPPEMFIGRTRELAKIRDMNGPNLVYGGRQLGKSILLKQVFILDNQPKKQYYAFYFDMKGKDDTKVLETISSHLEKAKLLKAPITTWDEFGDAIDDIMEKAKQLILLIDEADAFIQASNKVNEYPIEVLRKTQNIHQGRFKFVLAGLHNVIRYDKNNLSSNTGYGQLGHITICPFEFADACELLLKPLGYLGFKVANPEIVSTILSKTNYFPGLIQYYGQKILESVESAYQKNNFKSTDTPPYLLDETYLKNLMDDDSFLQEIENRFKITLRVDKDDDDFYYLITLGVAYLYAMEEPVTIPNLKQTLSDTKIANLSDDKLSALLKELEELNVLREVSDKEYIFNRYSFYSMMGGIEKIEKEIDGYAK